MGAFFSKIGRGKRTDYMQKMRMRKCGGFFFVKDRERKKKSKARKMLKRRKPHAHPVRVNE